MAPRTSSRVAHPAATRKAPTRKAASSTRTVAATATESAPKKSAKIASKKSAMSDIESQDEQPGPISNGKKTAHATKKADTISKAASSRAATKKAPTKKAASKKVAPKISSKTKTARAPQTSKKRARADTEELVESEATEPPSKRARSVSEAPPQRSAASRSFKASAPHVPAVKHPKYVRLGPIINEAPSTRLDVFVMGSGESGELGLGSNVYNGKMRPTNVKRPRLNHNLDREKIGVINVAAGGMHAAVLTHDSRILTWGVNDQWALGRDTCWAGGLRDIDAGDDDSSQETIMNPLETTPGVVDPEYFLPGTTFTQVVASDSATFALTADGRVYGWGTFRANNGILGFENGTRVQQTPKIIKTLHKIKKLAAGDNHILALNDKGKIWAWGDGEQQQLGRRVQERTRESALIPTSVGVKDVVDIACGRNHSFAIDKHGDVWAWGSNNFGQCGVIESAGQSNAFIFKPTKIEVLPKGKKINAICGGNHHSVACTSDGELISWGRIDGSMVGFSTSQIASMDKDKVILDERGNPRILKYAAAHEGRFFPQTHARIERY